MKKSEDYFSSATSGDTRLEQDEDSHETEVIASLSDYSSSPTSAVSMKEQEEEEDRPTGLDDKTGIVNKPRREVIKAIISSQKKVVEVQN